MFCLGVYELRMINKVQGNRRTTGRTFADTVGAVVGPEYREEPVKGSPYDGIGDWGATYLDPPVNGSAY